ncbi:unnamed protein product [Oikopleura dioica]|uniref:GrpE protein homolog n=1 Tax=Oikopleura dioica TaxID=34765 RepID=E4XM87_OIKDI|nr:unnamed protein product [Oikopleura dioica]CBY38213.1 unnamed protein product [Oikopleura dioica]
MPATSTVIISRREFFGKKGEEEKKTDDKNAENAEEQPKITLEEAVEQINSLESQLSEAKTAREKEEKDFKYRLSEIAQEMKSQKTRLDREAEKAKVYGIKSFAKDLLPVADQLQLALENVPVAELEQNKALADLKEGIEMTKLEIGKAFEKNQIILVSPNVGDIFDANIHEAVMRVPRAQMPDSEPNTVAFVQKTGYNIKDQVLRPCWVGVVSE